MVKNSHKLTAKLKAALLPGVLIAGVFLLCLNAEAALAALGNLVGQGWATPGITHLPEPPPEPPAHSYGISLQAGRAHPAWWLAYPLPYVMVAIVIMAILGMMAAAEVPLVVILVTAAVSIQVSLPFVDLVARAIP